MYQNFFFAKKKYQSIYKKNYCEKLHFLIIITIFYHIKSTIKPMLVFLNFPLLELIFLLLLYSRCSELSTTLDHNFYFTWY